MKNNYKRPANDNLSLMLEDIVPDDKKGTDKFLDVVDWNLRYFHDKETERVETISKILNVINADIFVFQEVMQNSLDIVEKKLKDSGAGYYTTVYGTTGGNQRIAIMYDVEWVRAKDDIKELFEKNKVKTESGKNAFPRLPLWAYFTCLVRNEESGNKSHGNPGHEPFDFQLVGLHLKSQRGGGKDQRMKAAAKLKEWMVKTAPKLDADVILLGDWNEPPTSDTWDTFGDLEKKKQCLFRSLNKTGQSNISHLMYKSKNEVGSRIDLTSVSIACEHQLVDKRSDVIHWKSLDDLLSKHPGVEEIKKYINLIRNNISDHMPVVTRFYFEEGK